MRCVQHTGNSNHYLACRGTKPQEAIDYLFDMLLKPGGQIEKGGQGQKRKNAERHFDEWMETDRQRDKQKSNTSGISFDKN